MKIKTELSSKTGTKSVPFEVRRDKGTDIKKKT